MIRSQFKLENVCVKLTLRPRTKTGYTRTGSVQKACLHVRTDYFADDVSVSTPSMRQGLLAWRPNLRNRTRSEGDQEDHIYNQTVRVYLMSKSAKDRMGRRLTHEAPPASPHQYIPHFPWAVPNPTHTSPPKWAKTSPK